MFERVAGTRARKSIHAVRSTQTGERLGVGVGPGEQRLCAAERLRPFKRVDVVLDAKHRRRVDSFALENAFHQLAPLGEAEDLRQRPCRRIGLEPLGRARAQNNHAVRRFPAQDFLPGEGRDVELWPVQILREGGRRRVADRQALAIGGNPVGVGHPDARGRAIPRENDVVIKIDLRQVGQFAIGRLHSAGVPDLELLDDVGDPSLAEAFPCEHVDAPSTEQSPKRHFDGARVRPRRNADAVVVGHAEDVSGQVGREFELGLADIGAMGAAKRGVLENCGGPAGALRARAGRKAGVRWPNGGRRHRHFVPSFQMCASRWGEVSRRG